jgi:HopA1 effector protein family
LDPAVLYLDKKYYQIGAQLVAEAYVHVRDHVKPTSPILTKVLAPGLSLAEDPPNGASFGMHRCGILAESLWEAHARGVAGDAAQLDLVETSFAKREVALERPYLNPGSVDWYTFSLLPERSAV